MYGKDKDQLAGEDERESRLARRSLQGLVVALVGLTVFAFVQLGVARTQTRIAVARQLVAQADLARNTDPRTALLLGIAAQNIAPAAESEMSLVDTLLDSRFAGSLTDHHRDVRAVAVSPDGRTLATGSVDESVLLWDLAGGGLPRRLGAPLTGHASGVNALAFAPDGRVLAAAAGNGAVELWDVSVPRAPQRLGGPLVGHTDAVNVVAFSPDGRVLATGGGDGKAILWDIAAHQPLAEPLAAHNGGVNSVVFSPDGTKLATANFDAKTAQLWDLAGLDDMRDHVVVRACALTGRGFAFCKACNTG